MTAVTHRALTRQVAVPRRRVVTGLGHVNEHLVEVRVGHLQTDDGSDRLASVLGHDYRCTRRQHGLVPPVVGACRPNGTQLRTARLIRRT